MTKQSFAVNHRFTWQIILGMAIGVIIGSLINLLPLADTLKDILINHVLQIGSDIFLRLLQLMVIPIVLVSLICGSSALGGGKKLGVIGGKSILLYILTTVIAVSIALFFAHVLNIGAGLKLSLDKSFTMPKPPSLLMTIVNIFPKNPFQALAKGDLLQVIVFALLIGVAISASGQAGKKFADVMHSANAILIKLILMIMAIAPFGVFFLIANLFAKIGFSVFSHLVGYFLCVLLVLVIQCLVVYSIFLSTLGRLKPWLFFRKMYSTLLFAFSVSSSNATIPLNLRTVESRLGVNKAVASFVVPLGATINMDGTAIMQGVATVFIANAYHLNIGLSGYLTVIVMAVLASIGTAGIPSVGLLTLAMVLKQVGLPIEGIALIIGIDRLLDMVRTAVNVSGDAMVACLVAKSEGELDKKLFNQPDW